MKKILFLFILVCGLSSCDSDQSMEIPHSELIGEWKMTQAFISAGGPQYWVDVSNGEEFVFFDNGTFISTRYSECTTGFYLVNENKLILDYDCVDFISPAENKDGQITFNLELGKDSFIASPTSGPICIEGCSYKYQRK